MEKKLIGILGGLGPETTAKFYLDVVNMVVALTGVRPALLFWNVPLNLAKEGKYFTRGENLDYYFTLLKEAAEVLIKGGVSRIVIPCNTVHEFYARLSAVVSVPIVNLIDVVTQEVVVRGWQEVLVLATSRTIQTELYQNALRNKGVMVIVPSTSDQTALDGLVEKLLGDHANRDHQEALRQLEQIIARSNTPNVVLGCTDLQLLLQPSENVIDSMHTLAVYTTKEITGRES